jgi:hypothetical protein
LPHVLKRIRLNLARSKDFPAGSAKHGYEFVAIPSCGANTARIAAFAGSGAARARRSGT